VQTSLQLLASRSLYTMPEITNWSVMQQSQEYSGTIVEDAGHEYKTVSPIHSLRSARDVSSLCVY